MFGGNLARVSSVEEFNFLGEEDGILNNTVENDIYIGLKRDDNADPFLGISFFFVDGDETQSFFEKEGEFPWRSERPNNFNGFGESCAVLERDNDNEWNDVECEDERPFICRVECDIEVIDDEVLIENKNENIDGFVFGLILFICLTIAFVVGTYISLKQLNTTNYDLTVNRMFEVQQMRSHKTHI